MSQDKPRSVVPLLSQALQRIRSTPPRIIASPPTQPRRAAVALIIRVVPSPHSSFPSTPATPPTLTEFFKYDWVKDPHAQAEILFLHRDSSSGNGDNTFNQGKVRGGKECHVAFPGGRMEADDEGGLYTAMRQTWEEIGVDLAEKDYICVGQLDDREITTSLGKRLLMILSPLVFLQVYPQSPTPDPIPTTQLCWTPLASLVSAHPKPKWSTVTVDAASRLTSKHSALLRVVVRLLVGSMEFPAIVLPPSRDASTFSEKAKAGTRPPHQLKLWGLSLGMTLDLMSYMMLPPPTPGSGSRTPIGGDSAPTTPLSEVMQLPSVQDFRMEYVAPSLASVFPRFSYPDVNFWIWVFGKRYREVVRGWESSVRSGGTNDRRINWSGTALSTFYAAIRKALVVVIVARALGIIFGLGFATWWIFGRA
ncbi:hypothetical protein FA15DRAFT_662346 [Coprinopsis marcescibilis]|uniref:Nudix hydrolase domain-containing protein n=1 Tax=Coprinopsis marcescibilis TaxID=230819 RepID=A0A5C3LC70_COPMA|nr:hypothetical protein FA15DRAFT_662346 [Coprinopsis marcescibilis]